MQQVITYQISGGKYLNFVAVCREPNGDGAPYDGKWVAEAPREELLSRFTHWEPEVQQMLQVSNLIQSEHDSFARRLGLLNWLRCRRPQCVKQPTRWAVHVVENLPFAVRGSIALVGDAVRIPISLITPATYIQIPRV